MSPIIVIIFSEGRHLWALISQLLKGQIEKFWCLSYREFPEFFKNGPTFYSSSTQWPSVTIFHKWHFFLGHPVYSYQQIEMLDKTEWIGLRCGGSELGELKLYLFYWHLHSDWANFAGAPSHNSQSLNVQMCQVMLFRHRNNYSLSSLVTITLPVINTNLVPLRQTYKKAPFPSNVINDDRD